MHSYAALDGVPPAADRALLTGLLRDELGFDGVVVADYYGISFLEMLHGVAGSPAQAAGLALRAGVDVELPTVRCYGEPLAAAISAGDVPEPLLDRALARVLQQKCELGLLDHAGVGDAEIDGVTGTLAAGLVGAAAAAADIDLDPPEHRALATQLAEESVVLLANNAGTLPLRNAGRLAVIGPLSADPLAYFGCYTFPRHVGHAHPGTSVGVPVEPLIAALARELPDAQIEHVPGCEVRDSDRSGFAAAIECATAADTVIAVLGDEAGLFGRGSSGEGCDASDLRLPGVQGELLDALAATGRPVVLVLITGRPYAIGSVAGRLAAVVQAFFPGQEGGAAIAGVLAGRVVPSGKLPIEVPQLACATQTAYRAPLLGTGSDVSSADPTPLYPFGHGLSYTTFQFTDLSLRGADGAGAGSGRVSLGTDGTIEIGSVVRNAGDRTGTEVVQLYLRDPVAQVVRPVRELAGFARVTLQPGQSRRVVFRLHADRTAFCGLSGERVVEAGLIEVDIGSSSADLRLHGELALHGPERTVGADRVLSTPVAVLDR
jgi:beta-xylosidase